MSLNKKILTLILTTVLLILFYPGFNTFIPIFASEPVTLLINLPDTNIPKNDLNATIQTSRPVGSIERVYNMEATFYTLECGNGDGYTATMTVPKVGRTVAVDPNIIPLGSTVEIVGLGTYIAEDTGGLVKGYVIDVYVGSGEGAKRKALERGRQQVKVIVRGVNPPPDTTDHRLYN